MAGLVPWWLTRWRVRGPLAHWAPVRAAGLTMLILGAIVPVQAFARFVADGHGTPAPAAPADRLVTGGLYRHVRNPMYLAVVARRAAKLRGAVSYSVSYSPRSVPSGMTGDIGLAEEIVQEAFVRLFFRGLVLRDQRPAPPSSWSEPRGCNPSWPSI